MEEKIYNKIEKMDEKLDSYIKEMENRVTKVEARVETAQGFIKVSLTLLISAIGATVTYILKQFHIT